MTMSEKKSEKGITIILGGLIILVGISEILKVLGIEPAVGLGIIKGLILLGIGLFLAFRK